MNATKYVVLIIIVSLTMVLSAQSTQAAPPWQTGDAADGWKCSFWKESGVYFYHLNGDGALASYFLPAKIGDYGPIRRLISDHRPLHLVYWADFWIELYDNWGRLDCRVTKTDYVSLIK